MIYDSLIERQKEKVAEEKAKLDRMLKAQGKEEVELLSYRKGLLGKYYFSERESTLFHLTELHEDPFSMRAKVVSYCDGRYCLGEASIQVMSYTMKPLELSQRDGVEISAEEYQKKKEAWLKEFAELVRFY